MYFDWIINEHFFINLYNETIFYPLKGSYDKDGYEAYLIASNSDTANTQITAILPGQTAVHYDNISYGYDVTFEVEPVFTTAIADGINFSAGLPINFIMTPGKKYDIEVDPAVRTASASGAILSAAGAATDAQVKGLINAIDGLNAKEGNTYLLSVKPNVSFFLTKTPMPLEFKLQYALPVWGMRNMARHSITAQVRVYFALPGRPE